MKFHFGTATLGWWFIIEKLVVGLCAWSLFFHPLLAKLLDCSFEIWIHLSFQKVALQHFQLGSLNRSFAEGYFNHPPVIAIHPHHSAPLHLLRLLFTQLPQFHKGFLYSYRLFFYFSYFFSWFKHFQYSLLPLQFQEFGCQYSDRLI